MDWLIKLVIEAIGIPPTFIDRGDPAGSDFTQVHITDDNAWHVLDLSTIVPAGASAVAIHSNNINTGSFKTLSFREHGNIRDFNVSASTTQVAWVGIEADHIVKLDADRKIDYKATAGGWVGIALTIKGWWL